jgi:hypothetical protein
MSLLFLGAKDHRIGSGDLERLKRDFDRLDREASRGVLQAYRSRKSAAAAETDQRRLPQLYA